MTSPSSANKIEHLENLVRRERAVIAFALVLITVLSWGYLLGGAGTGMSPAHMSTWQFPPSAAALFGPADWTPGYALLMSVMWFVMMAAMMLPSAAPMVLMYARVYRQGEARGQIAAARMPVSEFAGGYLAVWLGFSLAATALQYALEQSGLVDGMWMWSLSRYLTAALLIAAGLYQLTPLKQACLTQCRSPAAFLSANWQSGPKGAFRLGLKHGLYCLGCCWVLMLLLFAGGVMNLFWIAGLSALVLLEKLAPFGARLAKPIGLVLIAAGIAVAAIA